MARALRAVSTERGRDPRDFALLAFGGNGPVHAATLARLLEIRRILVPPAPGLFSALGVLSGDRHHIRTFKRHLDGLDGDALEAVFRAMEDEGAAMLEEEGFGPTSRRYERQIDLRYHGASSELTLPFPLEGDPAAALTEAFARAHERQYGYRSDEEQVETMNLRVIARGLAGQSHVPDRLSLRAERPTGVDARQAYFGPGTGWARTPVCGRMALGGAWRQGPLLIEEFDSTTVVPPDGRARLIEWDTIEVELA
jgi:N-methylhydantoinase A